MKSRGLTSPRRSPRGDTGEAFVESRHQKLGFPKFDDHEIVGSDEHSSVVVDVRYVGFGDELQDGTRRATEDVATTIALELSMPLENVAVFLTPLPIGHVDTITSYIQNEPHVRAWAKDNSCLQYLHITREDTTIVRHKCILVYFSTNLGLQHAHKNRVTGQIAYTLMRTLVSQWTGEALLCVFTHDGTRRLWRAPVQHSDKFGASPGIK